MIRHDDVRAVADPQVLDGMPAGAGLVDFLQQLLGVDDDAVPDDVHRAFPQDAGGEEVEGVEFVPHLHRVPRVRSALKAHDDVGIRREEVDDFPFAFIPELTADGHRRGHGTAATTSEPT